MKLTRFTTRAISQKISNKTYKLTNELFIKQQPKRFFSMNSFKLNQEEKKVEEEVKEEEEKVEETVEKKDTDDLNEKIKDQEIKIKELQQKYLSALADQENTRNIAKKDVESARKFALQNFALSLLEVPDTLHLALKSVPKEKLEEDGMKTFVQGIKMTENILLKVFKQYHITRMEDPTEQDFDPKFHEAILKVANENLESNKIQNVFKDGYLYHDRVLRAAQVSVVENEE
eukprot:gene3418-5963_t